MKKILVTLVVIPVLAACQSTIQKETPNPSVGKSLGTHNASWYGAESGRRTATGERFNRHGLTVAHRTLPFGTRLRITNPSNGRQVVARVNDRGPAKWTGRSLDVSEGTANALGFKQRGTARLRVEMVGR